MFEYKKKIYFDNISSTEILIEHIGEIDKPIYPILFKCSNRKEEKRIKLTSIPTAKNIKSGYCITLDKDQFKKVLDIAFSIASKRIDNSDELSDYGTFIFKIFYVQLEITELVFDKQTSIKIFKKILLLLPDKSDERSMLETLLIRMGK